MANLFLDGHKLLYHPQTVAKWLSGEDFPPIHVELSPTSACNQKCKLCYAAHAGHRPDHLPRELLESLVDSLAKMGVKSMLLAGDGEPLVNKHCAVTVSRARSKGIDVALNSNGVLMKPGISEEVLEHLTWMRYSIMAARPETYAELHGTSPDDLKKAADNIRAAVEIKKRRGLEVTIGIQSVLVLENGEEIPEIAALAKDIGVDYYVLKPFSLHSENAYDVPADLHERHEKKLKEAQRLETPDFKVIIRWNTFADHGRRDYERCLGLPFIAQIGADGGVYTCCPFFGDGDFLYGNLHDETFEQIWYGERRKKLTEEIARHLDLSKCMTYCRHHQINKFLWQIVHPPDHVNFI
ncbi:MAG: radical SAM protein [bacterium]